jgi:hypothetical protein
MMSFRIGFNFAGLVNSVLKGAFTGVGAALVAGHVDPRTLGQAAALGAIAKGSGFLEDPNTPPSRQDVIETATATVQTVVNTEINKAVPAIAQTVARHMADTTINNVAAQLTGQRVAARPAVLVPAASSAIPINVPRAAPAPVAAVPAIKVSMPAPAIPGGLTAAEWDLVQRQRQQEAPAANVDEGAPGDAPPAFQAPGA